MIPIRFPTRVVNIGTVPLGGSNPIRVQSMTNTDTLDTNATVAQAIRMIDAGCEYVRIAVPGIMEAENLRNIKNELHKRGYKTPLIADVHFNPNIAEIAAAIVEKVRINPGNYVDRKKKMLDAGYWMLDKNYNHELEEIARRIAPLISICKEHGTAIRIGTNHGSLSDRIMERFGDTPEGMVESALEFARICRGFDFHEFVLGMKASNVRVMIAANRLLVERMKEEQMNYPIHLGVTEAGSGEDGRIKSAIGIGSLLADGIGDTIRVSITEDPEKDSGGIWNSSGNRRSHHENGIYLMPFLCPHLIQYPGCPGKSKNPHRSPQRFKNRRDGLHRQWPGGNGRCRLRLCRRRKGKGDVVQTTGTGKKECG